MSHGPIKKAYDAWADTYDSDRNLTRDLDHEATRTTLADIRCQTILELGCGTGKNTAFLTGIGEKVYAADFSEGMLAKAKHRPGLEHVIFYLADIRQRWPCDDHSVDLVVCNLVLEHIADLRFIFSEASRTLVPGGRLFICELHPFRQYQGVRAKFASGQTEREIEAFVHNISDYLDAAAKNGLELTQLKEWWHLEDKDKPPRLVSFLFEMQCSVKYLDIRSQYDA